MSFLLNLARYLIHSFITGDKIVMIDAVKDKLGVKKGDLIIFYEEDNKVVIGKSVIEE